MKICNLHDDIGADIFTHQGEHRLDHFHYPRLKEGGVKVTALDCCFAKGESFSQMQEQILYLNQQVASSKFFSLDDQKEIQVILALEGMCGIQDNVFEQIHWLHQNNIRMVSLCWNDHNALACGEKSNPNQGLSPLGKECITALNHFGIAIDISHASAQTIRDICEISTTPIFASHSNPKSIFDHYRNLSDGQLALLTSKGGIVGLMPVRWFVSRDPEKETLEHFVTMIDYLKDTIGIHSIALGFDFMDYFGEEHCMVSGLENVTQSQHLVILLRNKGYDESEIQQICFDNAYNFIKPYLIY